MVSMPARRARSRPAASGRLEITTAIRASSRPSATASMIACRLLPRPEIRTPIDGVPLDIRDRAVAGDDAPDDDAAFAAAGAQHREDIGLVRRGAANDHPDPHIEGP